MAALRKKVGKIVALAEQIEADIRTRELTPGDRYLSTVDTARMLRVDTTDVNKALQLLVKRGVLIRRQRVGAVIADSFNNPDDRRFGAIHFLMSDRAIRSEGLFDSDMVMDFNRPFLGRDSFLTPFLETTKKTRSKKSSRRLFAFRNRKALSS